MSTSCRARRRPRRCLVFDTRSVAEWTHINIQDRGDGCGGQPQRSHRRPIPFSPSRTARSGSAPRGSTRPRVSSRDFVPRGRARSRATVPFHARRALGTPDRHGRAADQQAPARRRSRSVATGCAYTSRGRVTTRMRRGTFRFLLEAGPSRRVRPAVPSLLDSIDPCPQPRPRSRFASARACTSTVRPRRTTSRGTIRFLGQPARWSCAANVTSRRSTQSIERRRRRVPVELLRPDVSGRFTFTVSLRPERSRRSPIGSEPASPATARISRMPPGQSPCGNGSHRAMIQPHVRSVTRFDVAGRRTARLAWRGCGHAPDNSRADR